MPIRRLWIVLVLVFLPAAAYADDHRAFFFGGGYEKGSSLWGIHGTFDASFTGVSRVLSSIADVSIHSGSGVTRRSFMTGLRLALATSDSEHAGGVHALVGVVNSNDGLGTDSAVALGASWEYVPNRSTRGSRNWGVRVQADYVMRFDGADDFPRVSAGLLYRW